MGWGRIKNIDGGYHCFLFQHSLLLTIALKEPKSKGSKRKVFFFYFPFLFSLFLSLLLSSFTLIYLSFSRLFLRMRQSLLFLGNKLFSLFFSFLSPFLKRFLFYLFSFFSFSLSLSLFFFLQFLDT